MRPLLLLLLLSLMLLLLMWYLLWCLGRVMMIISQLLRATDWDYIFLSTWAVPRSAATSAHPMSDIPNACYAAEIFPKILPSASATKGTTWAAAWYSSLTCPAKSCVALYFRLNDVLIPKYSKVCRCYFNEIFFRLIRLLISHVLTLSIPFHFPPIIKALFLY